MSNQSSAEIAASVLEEINCELLKEQARQEDRYQLLSVQSAIVPCNALNSNPKGQIRLEINRDGDFVMEELRMFAMGPVDKNGLMLNAVTNQTAFPCGLKNNAGVDLASGGLAIQISEARRNIRWTDNYIDVPVIGVPGYSGINFAPFNLHAFMCAGNALVVDIINRDTATIDAQNVAYHYLCLAAYGRKYLAVTADKA